MTTPAPTHTHPLVLNVIGVTLSAAGVVLSAVALIVFGSTAW
jgi:hypothetical protein